MHQVTKTNLAQFQMEEEKIFVVVEAQHFHCTCGNPNYGKMSLLKGANKIRFK